jgi:hypothetical protein
MSTYDGAPLCVLLMLLLFRRSHSVTLLVEALGYKPEFHGFVFRRVLWPFQFT